VNKKGLSWSWSYGNWIYNYLCNQCLSPLMLWVQTRSWRGVLNTALWLCDKVCQLLAIGLWFSLNTLVSSINKTDRHDITEILLKVALSIINQTKLNLYFLIILQLRKKWDSSSRMLHILYFLWSFGVFVYLPVSVNS
jgi:hypothetical protein